MISKLWPAARLGDEQKAQKTLAGSDQARAVLAMNYRVDDQPYETLELLDRVSGSEHFHHQEYASFCKENQPCPFLSCTQAA
jgi:hypothetical protein